MAELQALNLKLLPNSGDPKIALGGNVTLSPRNGIKTHQVSGWFFRFIKTMENCNRFYCNVFYM
jgi:hypothetical protein